LPESSTMGKNASYNPKPCKGGIIRGKF